MRHALTAGLAVLLFTPTSRALDEPPEAKKSPQERYHAVLQEFQKATQDFSEAYQKAKTDEERSKVIQEKYPQLGPYARRFMEVADSAPDDPAAVSALIWVVQHHGQGPEAVRAVERLAAKHAGDRRVGEVAPNLVYSQSPHVEVLLRAVVEKNPDRDAKGKATLALGQYLKRQSETVRSIKDDPQAAKRAESMYLAQGYDKAGFDRLARRDPDAILKDAEAAFERAEKDFGDVVTFRDRTVGKAAKAELNELRNLGVGKSAPEITGEDIDGKPFKLSDYRGKVVVVDFWGDW
jgi:hypothetical protein